MTFDLVVRGGRIGDEVADVGVSDGVIASVGPAIGAGRTEVDAQGLDVLPGCVDAHVHLNDPGRAAWEGFETGTRALAAGGTTCAADMPLNAHPPTLDAVSFDAKADAAAGRLFVDIALWGGLVPANLGHLEELAARGVVGFKAFMCPSGIDDFAMVDEETLGEGMGRAAALGLPVAVHAESPTVIARLTETALREGRHGARDYVASRPVEAELEAIGLALRLAAETGCALHVVHVSSGRGVALVAGALAAGVDVTCETCPHYLLLGEDDLEVLGAVGKCAPPLRGNADREELLQAVRSGAVDTVGSDHSPAPLSLKSGNDFFAIWGGISGAQTLLVSLLELGFDSSTIARLAAGAPADRLGLPAKGRLEPGADADLTLVDPASTWKLRAEELHYRHPHSPFVGMTFRGRVERTILRGRTTWDGERFGSPVGRVLRRGG